MPNQNNREFLMKRSELIKKLRKNATIFQVEALIFIIIGLGLSIAMKVTDIENVWLSLLSLAGMFFGICFQVAALIYFSKAKKHLSGQTVNVSSNPKDWQ